MPGTPSEGGAHAPPYRRFLGSNHMPTKVHAADPPAARRLGKPGIAADMIGFKESARSTNVDRKYQLGLLS
jgi:hypothetical protein